MKWIPSPSLKAIPQMNTLQIKKNLMLNDKNDLLLEKVAYYYNTLSFVLISSIFGKLDLWSLRIKVMCDVNVFIFNITSSTCFCFLSLKHVWSFLNLCNWALEKSFPRIYNKLSIYVNVCLLRRSQRLSWWCWCLFICGEKFVNNHSF